MPKSIFGDIPRRNLGDFPCKNFGKDPEKNPADILKRIQKDILQQTLSGNARISACIAGALGAEITEKHIEKSQTNHCLKSHN